LAGNLESNGLLLVRAVSTAGPNGRAVKGVGLSPSLSGIAVSNLTMDMDACREYCQVESLRRADHPSRGVLPIVVSRIECDR
jgi:hypothetical protein